MTLGDVFKRNIHLGVNYNNLLDEVRTRIGIQETRKNLRDLKLEKELNEMFYDENKNIKSDAYNQALLFASEELEERLKSLVNNLEIGRSKITISNIESKELKNESQSRYDPNTVRELISNIEHNLAMVAQTKNLKKLSTEINKAITKVKGQLKRLEQKIGPNKKMLTVAQGKGFSTLRHNIETLHHISNIIKGMPDANAYGKAFELGANEALDNVKRRGEKDIEEVIYTAKKQVSRDWGKSNNFFQVNINFNDLENILSTKMPEHVSKKISGEGYEVITSPMGQSSAKADLIVKLKGNENPYQFSLKNWNNIFNEERNFGSTYLLNAIVRSSNSEESLRAYSLGLLTNYDAKVHEFAHLCIAADILMGIAQKNHYANYLVINDRKQKYIYVYHIGALISNMATALEIIGYEKNTLKNGAWKILRSIKGNYGRTDRYLSLTYGLLYSTIVSAKFQASILSKATDI